MSSVSFDTLRFIFEAPSENISKNWFKEIVSFLAINRKKNFIYKLEKIARTGTKEEFEAFLNSLEEDLRKGLLEILENINKEIKNLNDNIEEFIEDKKQFIKNLAN